MAIKMHQVPGNQTGQMGSGPILSIKVTINIDTFLNYDSDFGCHGQGNITCKHSQDTNVQEVLVLTATVTPKFDFVRPRGVDEVLG